MRGIKRFRYAVVGTGWIVEEFIRGMSMVEGAQLAAVCSRELVKGKNFADKYGANTVFTSTQTLAECGGIDAVYIASPNALHYEQSRLMLEHGKHVICEKPITVTPQQLEELQKLADDRGLIYMEAIMYMHLPNRAVLRESIKKIGRIRTAHFDFSQLSSKYGRLVAGELPNIFNPALATGCLMDLGIYCVYPCIDIFGVPQKITATAGFLETGADGYGTAVFHYGDKQVTFTYSKLGQDRFGSQFFGDKGTICLESISKLTNISLVDNDGGKIVLAGDCEKPELMSHEARSFVKYIKNPAVYAAEYEEMSKTALLVSKAMLEIREQAGIRFT